MRSNGTGKAKLNPESFTNSENLNLLNDFKNKNQNKQKIN